MLSYLGALMGFCFIFCLEKLLLASTKTEDYAFTVKGCPTADGIDDYEEFKATEVNNVPITEYSSGIFYMII